MELKKVAEDEFYKQRCDLELNVAMAIRPWIDKFEEATKLCVKGIHINLLRTGQGRYQSIDVYIKADPTDGQRLMIPYKEKP